MGMPVEEMLGRMSSTEFTEWLAFSRIEPFGSLLWDLRFGAIVSMLANINRDTKSRPEPFEVLDFMPWAKEESRASEHERTGIHLPDKKAHSALILAAVFGKTTDGLRGDKNQKPGGVDAGS